MHEVWLRLVGGQKQSWENRAHFFGAAAEAMRRILIGRARCKSRLKRGSGQALLDIANLDVIAAMPDDKVLLGEAELVCKVQRRRGDAVRLHHRPHAGFCRE